MTTRAPVAIIMGSRSDWPTMKAAAEALDELGVAYESKIVSAHRTPERLYAFAKGAAAAGVKVIIAGARGAAHLPGMTASLTTLPVLGVPVRSKALDGLDSLLSIVQMPAGVPVGTQAIGEAGARNAGLMAARILALADPGLGRTRGRLAEALGIGCTRTGGGLTARAGFPLSPGAVIGILGGGQLGRMLAMAAARLGFDTAVLDPEPDAPAARVSAHAITGAYDDPDALARLAELADVVTFEFENVPAGAIRDSGAELRLRRARPATGRWPSPRTGWRRIHSSTRPARRRRWPSPEVGGPADIVAALDRLGHPLLLKSRRGGYDGKGQAWIRAGFGEFKAAWVSDRLAAEARRSPRSA